MQTLLSRTQARPGRVVKQEQEQNSHDHLQTFLLVSVDAGTIFVIAEPHKLINFVILLYV